MVEVVPDKVKVIAKKDAPEWLARRDSILTRLSNNSVRSFLQDQEGYNLAHCELLPQHLSYLRNLAFSYSVSYGDQQGFPTQDELLLMFLHGPSKKDGSVSLERGFYGMVISFKGESSFSTYMYQICKNTVWNELERLKSRTKLIVNTNAAEQVENVEQTAIGPAERVARFDSFVSAYVDWHCRLQRKDSISDRHLDILSFRLARPALKDANIAELLGIKVQTARTRAVYAKITLRAILDEMSEKGIDPESAINALSAILQRSFSKRHAAKLARY